MFVKQKRVCNISYNYLYNLSLSLFSTCVVYFIVQEFEIKLEQISATQEQVESEIEERLVKEFRAQLEEQVEAKALEVETQKKKVRVEMKLTINLTLL